MIDQLRPTPARPGLHGPFVSLSLALGLGITAAPHFSLPLPLELSLVLLWAALFIFSPVLFNTTPKKKWAICWLLPLFFLAGADLARPLLLPPAEPDHLYQLLLKRELKQRHDLVLAGTLHELPRRSSGGRTRLILAVDELLLPNEARRTKGLVQLTLNGELPGGIRPGDELLIRARVGKVRAFKVPGAFDYRKFLAQRGIWLSGWISNPLQISKIVSPPGQKADAPARLSYLPERVRAKAGEIIDSLLLQHPSRPMLRALIIGDRSEIERETMEAFKAGGAMHLLAISGMHLGIIALMSIAVIEWLLKRSTRIILRLHVRKLALPAALVPIFAYALITGLQPPAVRSLIMILVFAGAVLCNRQWCSLNNLGLAALIILVLDPPALFGASFQLSFAATAGIILLVPNLPLRHESGTSPGRKIARWILAGLMVSCVATLVTAPFAIHHFHRLSLLSPITTLIASPPIFFGTLPPALLGLITAASGLPGGEDAASLLFTMAAEVNSVTVAMVSTLSKLPLSSFYLSPTTVSEFIVWALLFAVLAGVNRSGGSFSDLPLQAISRPPWGKRLPTVLAVALPVILLFLLPWQRQWQRQRDHLSRISFIEVGHGKSTVLELPGNRTFLIDGGGPSTISEGVGAQLIAPFLRHRGIKRLEGVVVSHPHADHYNGIPFILRHFRPRKLWINGLGQEDGEYGALLKLAKKFSVQVEVPQKGELLFFHPPPPGNGDNPGPGGEISLQNLAGFHLKEPVDSRPPPVDPSNDRGLVIGYRHGEISFLFPGDIGMGQERVLLGQIEGSPHHQVLEASHHGRWTSMSDLFTRAVSPRYLIISDDQRRVDMERVLHWRRQGATVFTTGEHGTITCITNGRELQCS